MLLFNVVCTCPDFMASLKKMYHEYSVFISNCETLFVQENTIETVCYKTLLENYEGKISHRIRRQYAENQKEFIYRQVPASHPDFMKKLLWLLENRQKHLIVNRPDESNNSYLDNFNDLIIEFCSKSDHCDTIRIEVLELVNSSETKAMSLNFYAPDGIMCYLRVCDRNKSTPLSFGLILDQYIMTDAKQNKYPVYDLTRGEESYKQRLGADRYVIYNQFIESKFYT